MGKRCTICDHGEKARVELSLAAGVSYAQIGRKFGVHRNALSRHKRNHMPPQLLASLVASVSPTLIDLQQLHKNESENSLQNVAAQRAHLWQLIKRCEELGDVRGEVAAHRALTGNLEFGAKLTGNITSHTQTITNNLVVSEDWLRMRSALIKALSHHPAARRAVAEVLRGIEGEEPHFTGAHPTPQIEAQADAVA